SDSLFELLQQILLVLEDVHRNVWVHPDDHRILASLEARTPDCPLDAARDRLGRKHASGAAARRPRFGHRLQMTLSHPLARHLDQPELTHGTRLRPGAITPQMPTQLLENLVTIRLRLHVDEVADDDAAQVAQPRLTRDLARS